METFRCPLDKDVVVIIVEKEDTEYEQVSERFKLGDHAFTILGIDDQVIIVDGEVVKEDWFTDDHLVIIMAHELGHLRTNSTDELTADQTGFDILIEYGAPESIISLYAMEIQARYCMTQQNLESHR